MLFAGGPWSVYSLCSDTSCQGRSPSRLSPQSSRVGSLVSREYSPLCRYRLLLDQTSPPLFSSFFSLLWSLPASSSSANVRLFSTYRQADTGASVIRLRIAPDSAWPWRARRGV